MQIPSFAGDRLRNLPSIPVDANASPGDFGKVPAQKDRSTPGDSSVTHSAGPTSRAAGSVQGDREDSYTTSPVASVGSEPLTESQKVKVQKLKQRDAEVRVHELMHMSVAGGYARSGPSYDYQVGPDGGRYAIGGQVQLDTSIDEKDPSATIKKMETIKKAALAPANPSAQDHHIAAQADSAIARAREQLRRTTYTEEVSGSADTGSAKGQRIDKKV